MKNIAKLLFLLMSFAIFVGDVVASTWSSVESPQASWGSTDVRYSKTDIPALKKHASLKLKAWRGESVNAQAVVWTGKPVEALNYSFGEFKNSKGKLLPKNAFSGGFVGYVMTDELNKNKKGGCGHRPDHSLFDSSMVADPIDHLLKSMPLAEMSAQGIWIKCSVPQSVSPGIYKGDVLIMNGDKLVSSLKLEIEVSPRTLPEPAAWKYHLDLWQNPFAVARYNKVNLWSQEHFDAMRPLMEMLAAAGQKAITASIMHKPWNGQTEDYFETMVTWMKKADGTWNFDYTVFDRWVEFMMSTGINKQISCYSMVPWALSFQYFDQASNTLKFIDTVPGEKEYEEMWVAMLTSFSKHLREKGWFDICMIAMDERPMEVMQKTLAVIRKADPEFKVSLAGNYHGEIEPEMYDYCISIGQNFPDDVKVRRAKEGKTTTYYTSCAEAYPNTFTFSDPAEAAWMSWYSAKDHLDGYLRWAYNSWPADPMNDSRFRTWAGGDTYLVYPEGRSSIRFEKLIEGVQAHEKINILRDEFSKTGNKKGLKALENLLKPFSLDNFPEIPAAQTVNKALRELNDL